MDKSKRSPEQRTILGPSITPGRSRGLFALTCGALLAVCLIVGLVMLEARDDIGREVAVSAANLATAVAHDVDRNIEHVDGLIQAAAAAWETPAVRSMPPEQRDLSLFERAPTAGIGPIIVLDRDGFIQATSRPLSSRRNYLGDRDFFRVHAAADVGLFVSKPFISRMNGRWQIGLSRRVSEPDGSFGGVVLGTIELSSLNGLYDGLDLGPGGSITLFRTDGTVITRAPYVEADVHRFLGATDGFNRIRPLRSGSGEGPSPVDGQPAIMSFHRVGGLPLIQVVEVSRQEAYAGWWRKALVIGGSLGVLGLSSVALMLVLRAELARRAEAEAGLARLATTDALTELPNRRRFVQALDAAWAAAHLRGGEISLLMIDADRFKAYNDAFGHPAGDRLLKTIAGRLVATCRPGDLACRYGGEEFTLILPDTGPDQAFAVAERVRTAIAALREPHPATLDGVATVSVGIATMMPAREAGFERLVAAADAALYRAKSEGRNRSAAPVRPPQDLRAA